MTDPNVELVFESTANGVDERVAANHEAMVNDLLEHVAADDNERSKIFAGLSRGFMIGMAHAAQVMANDHPELDGGELLVKIPFRVRPAEKIRSADADGDEVSGS